MVLTYLYYYVILDKRFSSFWSSTYKAHHALEFTRELLRDAIPRKGSFEKTPRVPCRKNLETWG